MPFIWGNPSLNQRVVTVRSHAYKEMSIDIHVYALLRCWKYLFHSSDVLLPCPVEQYLCEVHRQNMQAAQGVSALPQGEHVRDDEQVSPDKYMLRRETVQEEKDLTHMDLGVC